MLAPDGSYLGTVTAGSLNVLGWLQPIVTGDMFLAVVTDELGLPYVVRARIVPVERADGRDGPTLADARQRVTPYAVKYALHFVNYGCHFSRPACGSGNNSRCARSRFGTS